MDVPPTKGRAGQNSPESMAGLYAPDQANLRGTAEEFMMSLIHAALWENGLWRNDCITYGVSR